MPAPAVEPVPGSPHPLGWSPGTQPSILCGQAGPARHAGAPAPEKAEEGVSQLSGPEVPTSSTSPYPPPEPAPAWDTHYQPSADTALPASSKAGAKGSSRSGCCLVGWKYLLTPQVDHFPQELEQLSLVWAQPCPVGARRGHEENHQVVGRRRHGATGPAERIKRRKGRSGEREEAGNFPCPRRFQARPKRQNPQLQPHSPRTWRGGGARLPPFPTPFFPEVGGSRSHTNCTPGKGAMAASFSARGRGTTCPPPAHVVQVTHTWRRRPLAPPGGDVAARRGRDCGAGIAGPGLTARGRDCGRVARARRRRSIPGPPKRLSVPRRRPGPRRAAPSAVEVRCSGMVQLLSDGARSPGPAGTCRTGQVCPAPGSPGPRTEGQGDGHAAHNSPALGCVPGSAVASAGRLLPGAAPAEGHHGLRAVKQFLSSSRQRQRSFCTVLARQTRSCVNS